MKHHIGLIGVLAILMSNSYALDIEKDFTEKMVNAIDYVDTHQSETWPNFRLSSSAIIGHFEDENSTPYYTHQYAFNFQPQESAWQRIIVNQKPVYYLDKDLYEIANIAWGFDEIDGQLAYISSQTPIQSGAAQAAKTIYFRFFIYQHFEDGSRFEKINPWAMPGYGWIDNQVTLARLYYIEMEALKAYLQSHDADVKETSLSDAIAINQHRATLLDAESRQFEPFHSINWGLSSYVGWKSLNLSGDQYGEALPPICDIFSATSSDYESVTSCLYYYRSSFSTLVYGMALDSKIGPSWKFQVEKERVSPEELVRKHIGLSDAEATARTMQILADKRYNTEKIDGILNQSFVPYVEAIKLDESHYKQQAGIELEVFNKAIGQIASKQKKQEKLNQRKKTDEFMFINNNVLLLKNNNGRVKHKHSENGTLYLREFNKIPYYFGTLPFSNVGHDWEKYKIASDTVLVIDGKVETAANLLSAHKVVKFTNLAMENKEVKMKLNNVKGELDSSGDRLKLTFRFE